MILSQPKNKNSYITTEDTHKAIMYKHSNVNKVANKLSGKLHLFASPKSDIATSHHSNYVSCLTNQNPLYQKSLSNKPTNPTIIDMAMVNIEGLVTQTHGTDKCKFLNNIIHQGKDKESIIAITETWLTSDHLDEEILQHFPNHSIIRGDRTTKKPQPNSAPSQPTPSTSNQPAAPS